MLDARHELQRNASKKFSAQQLVNCVPNPRECGGSGGCAGATVELAMEYIEEVGLHEEHDVPYRGTDQSCNQQPASASSFLGIRRDVGAQEIGLTHWHQLPQNKAEHLMRAVVDGPVAVSVGANEWYLYSSGIFDSCKKDAVVNHAVTLFGYDQDAKDKYWLVRNSWGSGWGEKGFIRLLRQNTPELEEAHCGTDRDPAAGTACKPYPETQRVCGVCGILFDSVEANFAP
jgi:cathepsin L